MLTKKILDLASNMLQRSYTYYSIGKDIYEYSNESIKRHLNPEGQTSAYQPTLKTESGVETKEEDKEIDSDIIEKRREQLKKNMEIPEADDSFVHSKQESMKASQGVADHSGSSYHGPGKPGDKSNANMWQRNFENHQGN